jgi:hypothetical protein
MTYLMAAATSQISVNGTISDDRDEVSCSDSLQCCLLMKRNVQALEKEIGSLTEVIKVLSEELKFNDSTDGVRKTACSYADILKGNNMINCKCDQIKPQLLATQNELSPIKTITDIISEELKNMKQKTHKNLCSGISSSNVTSSKVMASSITIPTHSKLNSTNYGQYAVPTENRYDIFSNYQDLQYNDSGCLYHLEYLPRPQRKTCNIQNNRFYRDKSRRMNTTSIPSPFPKDNHNLQKSEKNEDATSFIPTIVNGITSVSTTQETVTEASDVTSDVESIKIKRILSNLRESINDYHTKTQSSKKHRIIIIGDSNIKGYASSLQLLLNSNYNICSIVKPGSGSKELEVTANEAISRLTHDDMIILCYSTSDLNLNNPWNSKGKFSCTYQNIKKFLMKNNHTNILLMNIPHRYDIPNAVYINKIISMLNRKLQKLATINPHTNFLEIINDRNLFTNHGLHRNKLGKNLVKLVLASSVLTAFVTNTTNPIPLEWYEENIEMNGSEEIKLSKTTSRNSCRNRKVPVTRTKDFLWTI